MRFSLFFFWKRLQINIFLFYQKKIASWFYFLFLKSPTNIWSKIIVFIVGRSLMDHWVRSTIDGRKEMVWKVKNKSIFRYPPTRLAPPDFSSRLSSISISCSLFPKSNKAAKFNNGDSPNSLFCPSLPLFLSHQLYLFAIVDGTLKSSRSQISSISVLLPNASDFIGEIARLFFRRRG